MRKIIWALMALILAVALWGCGQEDTVETTGATETQAVTTAPTPKVAAETVPATTAATQPPATEAATVPATTAVTEPVEAPVLSMGTYQDGTYENPFLGVTCTLSQDYTYKTEEELLTENGIAKGTPPEETQQTLIEADRLLFMEAGCVDDGSRIWIRAIRKGAHEDAVDAQSWLTAQSRELSAQLTGEGASQVDEEPVELHFAARTEQGMLLTAHTENQQQFAVLLVYEVGEYLVCVTITAPSPDKLDTLLLCLEIA